MGCAEGGRPVDLARQIRDSGLRFGVTGATGWLGRAATEVLAAALSPDQRTARLALFASRARAMEAKGGVPLMVRPLAELADANIDVLLHFAYVTREYADEHGLAQYVTANVDITAQVTSFILLRKPRFVAYGSSGAASQALLAPLDLGGNPYGALKVLDERVLRQASQDVGARSLVLRVFNVAGPWMTKPDAFAIGDLIGQASAASVTRIRAERPVIRSFVDVEDIAAIMIAAALTDTIGPDVVVDTAGVEEIEVGALAARVRSALNLGDGTIERSWNPDAAPDRYVGSPEQFSTLARALGIPLRPLDEQIRRTAEGLGCTAA